MTEENTSLKTVLLLALSASLLIAACFFIAGASGGSGKLVSSEPDSLIYMQYAKSISQGTPYIYSPGDTPSTGSTSHIYPFILAAMIKLGATGNSLFVAGFIFNILCMMGTIVCFALFARKFLRDGWILALALTVLSGQFTSAHFGQTDMGLLCFLVMGFFTALAYRRKLLYTIALVALGFSRPEGLIFSVALLFGSVILWKYCRARGPAKTGCEDPEIRCMLTAGVLGLIAFAAVLLLNRHLTGYFPFMSTMNKGYFNQYPFFSAVSKIGTDLLVLFKGYFLGLPSNSTQFYSIPIFTAIFGIGGILLRNRQDERISYVEMTIAGSAGATLLMVASSGWAGISSDRYFVWITPFWMLYTATGIHLFTRKISVSAKVLLTSFFLLFQIGSLIHFIADYHIAASYNAKDRNFYEALNEQLPTNSMIGQIGALGNQYYAGNLRLLNISGIETPVFSSKDPFFSRYLALETIKHNPELRFDYWVLDHKTAETYPFSVLTSDQISEASEQLGLSSMKRLYKADWVSMGGGTQPLLSLDKLKDKQLIGMLDIGLDRHRQKYGYETYCRLTNVKIGYGICTHPLGIIPAFTEVGLPIIGYEAFNVDVDPEKDLVLVLRTVKKLEAEVRTSMPSVTTPEISSPMHLNIMVNKKLAGRSRHTLNEKGYTELIIMIPRDCMNDTTAEIVVGGDHISCAYWFYQ